MVVQDQKSICDRLYLSRQLHNELLDNELFKGYSMSPPYLD